MALIPPTETASSIADVRASQHCPAKVASQDRFSHPLAINKGRQVAALIDHGSIANLQHRSTN